MGGGSCGIAAAAVSVNGGTSAEAAALDGGENGCAASRGREPWYAAAAPAPDRGLPHALAGPGADGDAVPAPPPKYPVAGVGAGGGPAWRGNEGLPLTASDGGDRDVVTTGHGEAARLRGAAARRMRGAPPYVVTTAAAAGTSCQAGEAARRPTAELITTAGRLGSGEGYCA